MSERVLFDAPGPRARRRHALVGAVCALLVLAAVGFGLAGLRSAGALDSALWSPVVDDSAVWRHYLLPGIAGTVSAASISVVLAAAFGLVCGLGRLSAVRAVRWVSGVVVELFRAVPVLVLMVAGSGILAHSGTVPASVAPLAGVVIGLTLHSGSVIAELVRTAVQTLPKGQREAALAVGLTRSEALRSVELPQAILALLPALVGQLVVIIKDSALGYSITYLELLSWSTSLGSAYANTIPAYVVAAILFVAVNYTLTASAHGLERRLQRRGWAVVDPLAGAS